MRMAILAGGWVTAALVCPATAVASVQQYQGDATDAQGRVLYHEVHYLYQQAGAARRLVLYRCPDGKPFARKTVAGDGATPNFAFVDGRDGYEEGVKGAGAQRQVYWREGSGKPIKRKPVQAGGSKVFDAGFDAMVRRHWTPLIAGKAIKADFLIPSHLRTLGLSLQGQRDGDVLRLQMRPSAWYGFAVPPIRLVYSIGDQWLSRFSGVGTIRDGVGRHRAVQIHFPRQALQAGVHADELTRALAAPLVGRCAA